MRARLLLLLAGLSSSAVLAQTPIATFELERLPLNAGGRYTLLQQSGDTLPVGALRVGLLGHYQQAPFAVRSNRILVGTLVEHRWSAHLLAAYGLFDWLELSGQIPVVVDQRGEDLTGRGVASPAQLDFGAAQVQGRAALFRQEKGKPLDLAFSLGVSLPTGAPNGLTRDSGTGLSLMPRLGAGRRFDWLRVSAELAANIRAAVRIRPSDEVVGPYFSGAAGLGILSGAFTGELGVRAYLPLTSQPVGAELLGGVRWTFANVAELSVLGGLGLARPVGVPAYRVLFGLAYVGGTGTDAPPAKVASAKVACLEGEDYVVADCPRLDRDGDGISNADDRCPEDKGVRARQGCPDGDGDGDGVRDADDACPKEAGLASNRGCPPPDADDDGIADADDACPKEAGPAERKGCPSKDADDDGIADADDACPKEAGLAELKGCPEKDGDGDGTADRFDNCPAEKGDKDNSGCPKAKKQLVVITKEKLQIKEKVFFTSGKASILPKSFPLLQQIADVLKAHPELTKVVIEGHTDDKGVRAKNLKLSQQRADAVKKWLSGKGVAFNRLDAKGYGPDKPAASNATEAGREANRRVEFTVVH